MNIRQMSRFLSEVRLAHKNGLPVLPVINRYGSLYKNVYIYNDRCVKSILTGDGKDLSLVTNLANAALRLTGSDCITNPRLENPMISGGLIYKDIEEDILISRERPGTANEEACRDGRAKETRRDDGAKGVRRDRIGLEFQHIGYDAYNNRLLFYVARHVGSMLNKGDFYDKMQNINIISFQMFDYLPWEVSRKYVHSISLMDDELNTFSDQQKLTIVEIGKFLKHANTDYAADDSRLAQWLRAIDALNNNRDFSAFANDKHFRLLQKRAEVSTFAPGVFIKAGERMKDDVEVAAYVARQEERKKYEAKLAESAAKMADSANREAKSAELIASLQAENSKYMAENSRYMAEIAMLREMLAQKG